MNRRMILLEGVLTVTILIAFIILLFVFMDNNTLVLYNTMTRKLMIPEINENDSNIIKATENIIIYCKEQQDNLDLDIKYSEILLTTCYRNGIEKFILDDITYKNYAFPYDSIQPIITIINRGGGCADRAVVAASISKRLNFDNIYLIYQPYHVCIAVQKNKDFDFIGCNELDTYDYIHKI